MSVSKSGNAYRTGSVYGNSQSISVSGGNHRHTLPTGRISETDEPWGGSVDPNRNSESGAPNHTNTSYSGDLTLSGTMTPSITDSIGVTDNISVSLGNGDVETRPLNYTIRIYKRIA